MGALERVQVEEIITRGSIKDSDVLRLSRALDQDTRISQHQAERMFALNASCPVQAPSWRAFFIPALTEHVINQVAPEGYVTAEKSKWLVAQMSKGGRVETKAELDLLLAILARARWAPASLVTFALMQVRDAVIHGDGPLRAGDSQVKGLITAREVDLVRDILCAFSGGGAVPITRPEAEVLFEINAALTGGSVSPAWADLFAKAVANLVMAAGGLAVPSRETALVRDPHADSRPYLSTRGAMTAAIARSFGAVRAGYGRQSPEERAVARLERQRIEIVTNEAVAVGEVRWLASRLTGKAALSPLEDALFAYLWRESLIAGPLLAFARHRSAVRSRDGEAA